MEIVFILIIYFIRRYYVFIFIIFTKKFILEKENLTMNEIVLKEENGQVLASSREVAEKFGKNHKEVLRAIKNISKEISTA